MTRSRPLDPTPRPGQPPRLAALSRQALAEGAVATLALLPSIVAYGLVLGVLAAEAGLAPWHMALMSAGVFAGSAQFLAVEMWRAPDTTLLALLAATFAINLRYILITASLASALSHAPWPMRLLGLHLCADENWALTMARQRQQQAAGEATAAAYLLGGGLTLLAVWLPATVIGTWAGRAVPAPEAWGLDFAFTAIFLALVVSLWRGVRADLLPYIVAAGVALAADAWLPGRWSIVLGGLAGAVSALLTPAPPPAAGSTAAARDPEVQP